MKTFFKISLLVALLGGMNATGGLACNLSHVTLDSLRQNGSTYDVYLTLCIGAGRTGATMGAGAETYEIYFTIYGDPAIRNNVTYWTPSVTGTNTGATLYGDTIGVGWGFGEVQNLYYVDPVNYSEIACITSTATCGDVHSECKQFHFTFNNYLPDSIQVLGVEGQAPFGGCYGLTDMVIVFSNPPCVTANAGADQTIQSGNCANLSGSGTGGTSPYTYAWSTGATTANITVCPTATTTYTLSVTDANSCTRIDQVTVNVYSCAGLTVNAGTDRTVYYGYAPQACTNLTATATGATAPYTYAWSNGGTTATINVCPTATTTYTVTATDANGCTTTDQVIVTVVDVRCGNGLTKVLVCRNGTQKCISQSQVPSHLASGWSLGPCGAKMTAEVIVPELSLSPNPAQDEVRLSILTDVDAQAILRIQDAQGRVLLTPFTGNVSAGEQLELVVNTKQLSPGIYFVSLHAEERLYLVKRLVIKL